MSRTTSATGDRAPLRAKVRTDDGYRTFERLIASRVANHEGPLLTTSATPDGLWHAFLDNLPADKRQHYNCHACRRFVQTYGGLVKVEAGKAVSLLWAPSRVPPFFKDSVLALRTVVASSAITGVFLSDEGTLGTPHTDNWTHLHGELESVHVSKVQTAGQAMAEKREDYAMLQRALDEFNHTVAAQAIRVLKADALDRGEKALGIGQWFHDLHGKSKTELWHAVATAPPGFCHVRNTMIGTLLEDIHNGLEFEEIARRWKEKMHPLQYQRPQAPPKEGAIKQAEDLVEKLGCAKSFARRYAKLTDVTMKLWTPRRPKPAPKEVGGVFGHLHSPKPGTVDLELPAKAITWEKFQREILPEAHTLEVKLPGRGPFFGLVTARYRTAPNLMQWDNPCSWYYYQGGSSPAQWGLHGAYGKVSAVFPCPPHWEEPEKFKHHTRMALFAIEGAWDTQYRTAGLGLFPECLRTEFHGIRSVLEAHSKKGGWIEGAEEGTANGLGFQDGRGQPLTLRVDGSASYTLDRWD